MAGVNPRLYPVIDANINRLKEGLRVAEDIARFILADRASSASLKKIRHNSNLALKSLKVPYSKLLASRDSGSDVGRRIKNRSELKRENIGGVLISNLKRAQESLRVLEEVSKLSDKKSALKFKELRYETYACEKKLLSKTAHKA
ncbi:MAG TPA: thiamine-phosphate pyrophosphorylase [bacterium]|nr:thiamine-phosphate pyrophosphorylase [bacterium]